MKRGNFEAALIRLTEMLVACAERGNKDCREILMEWDRNRGNDWFIKEEKRYVFACDDDGHNYMIPVEMKGLFNEQVELDWDDPENMFDALFEEDRVDSISEYTFTNPK